VEAADSLAQTAFVVTVAVAVIVVLPP